MRLNMAANLNDVLVRQGDGSSTEPHGCAIDAPVLAIHDVQRERSLQATSEIRAQPELLLVPRISMWSGSGTLADFGERRGSPLVMPMSCRVGATGPSAPAWFRSGASTRSHRSMQSLRPRLPTVVSERAPRACARRRIPAPARRSRSLCDRACFGDPQREWPAEPRRAKRRALQTAGVVRHSAAQ